MSRTKNNRAERRIFVGQGTARTVFRNNKRAAFRIDLMCDDFHYVRMTKLLAGIDLALKAVQAF
jgi:hypothetical protein